MKAIQNHCPNCGALLQLADNKTSRICPYCDSVFLLTLQELAQADDIAAKLKLPKHNHIDIIRSFCFSYQPKCCDIYAAYSLKNFTVYDKAQKHFRIPPDDDAFLFYDDTIFSTLRVGFALCTSGLYYRDGGKKTGMFDYERFKKCKIYIVDELLYIDDTFYYTNKESSAELYEILTKLQEMI